MRNPLFHWTHVELKRYFNIDEVLQPSNATKIYKKANSILADKTPAVLIFTPIFLPVVTTLGMDPVHFGIVIVLNLCIGICTPPVGTLLFISSEVAKVLVTQVIRPLLPFLAIMVIVLMLISFIPEISMFLPRLFNL